MRWKRLLVKPWPSGAKHSWRKFSAVFGHTSACRRAPRARRVSPGALPQRARAHFRAPPRVARARAASGKSRRAARQGACRAAWRWRSRGAPARLQLDDDASHGGASAVAAQLDVQEHNRVALRRGGARQAARLSAAGFAGRPHPHGRPQRRRVVDGRRGDRENLFGRLASGCTHGGRWGEVREARTSWRRAALRAVTQRRGPCQAGAGSTPSAPASGQQRPARAGTHASTRPQASEQAGAARMDACTAPQGPCRATSGRKHTVQARHGA
jgi:hypothetical protein